MRALPEQVSTYLDGRLLALGTDGFGRSETRQALRRFFEVDAESVTVAALYALSEHEGLDRKVVQQAIKDLGIDATAGSVDGVTWRAAAQAREGVLPCLRCGLPIPSVFRGFFLAQDQNSRVGLYSTRSRLIQSPDETPV